MNLDDELYLSLSPDTKKKSVINEMDCVCVCCFGNTTLNPPFCLNLYANKNKADKG